MKINFDIRLFIYLTIAFVFAAIIGTVSHESGHYLVAKILGYVPTLHYGWTDVETSDLGIEYNQEYGAWILAGGPFQTMLTGTIGIVLLFAYRQSYFNSTKLSFWQWTLIFISLFWLRQSANLFVWISSYFLNGHLSRGGDEVGLAYHMGLPNWMLLTVTGIIGFIVLGIIILRFIPVRDRLTFIISGLVGGIIGFVLWMNLLGKYILP